MSHPTFDTYELTDSRWASLSSVSPKVPMIKLLKILCQRANDFQRCSEDKVSVITGIMYLTSLAIFSSGEDCIYL